MSLHPLDDRIVVRPGESEETTASGLVIPDTAKEKPQQGEVLAVGPGRRAENTGGLIGFWRALGRDLFERLLAIVLFIPWLVDMLFPIWDPRNQTLHDKVAKTVVIRARATG